MQGTYMYSGGDAMQYEQHTPDQVSGVNQAQAQGASLAPRPPSTPGTPSNSAMKKQRSKGAKVFQCTGYGDCNMTFSRSEHLARHIRKHTGERPFRCHCGRTFSRLDNLRQHVQTVHANESHLYNSYQNKHPSSPQVAGQTLQPGYHPAPGNGVFYGGLGVQAAVSPPPMGVGMQQNGHSGAFTANMENSYQQAMQPAAHNGVQPGVNQGMSFYQAQAQAQQAQQSQAQAQQRLSGQWPVSASNFGNRDSRGSMSGFQQNVSFQNMPNQNLHPETFTLPPLGTNHNARASVSSVASSSASSIHSIDSALSVGSSASNRSQTSAWLSSVLNGPESPPPANRDDADNQTLPSVADLLPDQAMHRSTAGQSSVAIPSTRTTISKSKLLSKPLPPLPPTNNAGSGEDRPMSTQSFATAPSPRTSMVRSSSDRHSGIDSLVEAAGI